MAERYKGDEAAANGFDRRTLHEEEAHALYKAWYIVLPDMPAPGECRLSMGGIPIPPEARGNACVHAMHQHFYIVLMP
jgi:hypothetical protein